MKKHSYSFSFAILLSALTAVSCGSPQASTPIIPANNSTGTNTTNGSTTTPTNGSTSSSTPTPSSGSSGSSKPIALIYKGPGSCSVADGDAGITGYGCSEAACDVATVAGYQCQYVGPTDLSNSATAAQVSAIFGSAKVWIQPGGYADEAYNAMTTKLRSSIVSFVSSGGGYVGFCAGAFLAASGFNIFPGDADLYSYQDIGTSEDEDYNYLPIKWGTTTRDIYFEGGPYFHNLSSAVEVMATFGTSSTVAAARVAYGLGRVYVSGPHPEAPAVWGTEDGNNDPDGNDYAIGAQMVQWAGGTN
jgi:hypothetical protein